MTTTAQTEDALLAALKTIRLCWPLMTKERSSNGAGAKSSDVLTGLDHIVSLRHDVTTSLNGWARIVVEERDLHHHLPSGSDTLGLVELLERHARWMSGHEAGEPAADEIADWAAQVKAVAFPKKREWMLLGDCPFVIEDWFCSGQVRAKPEPVEEGREDSTTAACTECGQETVVGWWREVLDVADTVTRDELADFIRKQTGRVYSRVTLWRWIKAERFKQHGIDATGSPIYSKRDVLEGLAESGAA